MPFSEFAHKLFVLFFFSEFLNQCALSFRSLDLSSLGRVRRSEFATKLSEVINARSGEFSCPRREAVEEALKATTLSPKAATQAAEASDPALHAPDEIMFNSFCVDLFAHPMIYQALE
jgi:hypothetical protein